MNLCRFFLAVIFWPLPTFALDLSTLSASQRQTFDTVAREEFCTCGSVMSLAGCLSNRPNCHSASRLGDILARHVSSGANANAILAYFAEHITGPFCRKPVTFSGSSAPAFGPKNAPVVLVEFADFRCSHCRQAAPYVHAALQRHPKNLRYIFMPFPLLDHPHSVAAAEAALAAHAQGKFFAMHDALFAQPEGRFDFDVLEQLAKTIKLNARKFRYAMSKRRYKETVMAIKQQGVAAHVEGTPRFFINGRPFDFDPDLFTFDDRIAWELTRHQGDCQ